MLPHKCENAVILEMKVCGIVSESNSKNLESNDTR